MIGFEQTGSSDSGLSWRTLGIAFGLHVALFAFFWVMGIISFRTENSLFEKQGSDHIGSGIGLENMKRRLELLYPGKYTYSQKAGDGTYSVEVTLKV